MSKLNCDAELVRRIRITKPTWLMPCQNCGYVGSHTKRSCNEIEEEQRKDLNEAADLLTYYSDDAHESHPWHSHSQIIRDIATSLDRDISGLHQFCCETFQLYSCGKEVDFKDGLIPLIEYHKSRSLDIWLNVKLRGGVDRDEMKAVIWRFAATLSKTADRIRSNIIPLQSNYYPKQWAVKMVMNRDIYASDRKAIKDMIAKKQIPPSSGALLSKLVQYERNNIFFVHDEWKSVRNNKRGGLKLALIIVYTKYDVTATNDRRKYNGLYQPMIGVWFYSPPSIVCLKDHFGVSKDTRLYFSPHQFPTSTDLNHGDICVSFFRLKKYIIECSMKEGEVACNSGGKMGKSK